MHNKGDKSMKDETSYLVKGIDRDLWIKFKVKCIKSEHRTIAELFRWFIKEYSRGNV
tara:strand:- start:108 stop:278 length:171 start_codon:yes stop_codon:yes gene_type:complete